MYKYKEKLHLLLLEKQYFFNKFNCLAIRNTSVILFTSIFILQLGSGRILFFILLFELSAEIQKEVKTIQFTMVENKINWYLSKDQEIGFGFRIDRKEKKDEEFSCEKDCVKTEASCKERIKLGVV